MNRVDRCSRFRKRARFSLPLPLDLGIDSSPGAIQFEAHSMNRHSMMVKTLGSVAVCGFFLAAMATAAVFRSADFGVRGDGVADDGPAISRMVAAALAHQGEPAVLQMEEGKTYRVSSIPGDWLFEFHEVENLVLDGGGSVFLLDAAPRFLSLERSKNVVVRQLKVDYSPLPFADGLVVSADENNRRIGVELAEGATAPHGGPTRAGGEQAFFAMLWNDGSHIPLHTHCTVEHLSAGDRPGLSFLTPAKEFKSYAKAHPGKTRISLPIPGIAHRRGPGGTFQISGSSDIAFEDVELWSAPWFGFEVNRNIGKLSFLRTHIRPKPGSGRLMSTWRDGFHVKGNRGPLLWDSCIVSGMCDDAFNISTHSSVVSKVISPTRIQVRQKFPLLFIPWHQGGSLSAADEATAKLLGSAGIVKIETRPSTKLIEGKPAAPQTEITLANPIPGLAVGTMVWDPASTNPETLLKNCTIEMSCRFQSPVKLEGCTARALIWFYAEKIEGVFPSGASVRNCSLYRGRGNASAALIVKGSPSGNAREDSAWASPRAVHDVTIENNRIYGAVTIEGVENLRFKGNRLFEKGFPLQLRRNPAGEVSDNIGPDGNPIPAP